MLHIMMAARGRVSPFVTMTADNRVLVGFHSANSYFSSGACFDAPLRGFGDGLDASIKTTASRMTECGFAYAPSSLEPIENFDAMVFLEMPAANDEVWLETRRLNIPAILVVAENLLIERKNAQYERYKEFKLVFTYEDKAIEKYGCRRLDYAFRFDDRPRDFIPFGQRKFANMITSRVKKLRPGLVSYQRLWTIAYYENNHSNEFDLFGIGWEKGRLCCPSRDWQCRMLSRLGLYRMLPNRRVKTWRGRLDGKRDTIAKYRFSYCYENTTLIPGYITEKLFDVLMAETVPVYLGAPETAGRLPKGLYVDRASFRDDADLYRYLRDMSETEWMGYIENGRNFVHDRELRRPFTDEHYSEVLVNGILEVLQQSCVGRKLKEGQ